MHAATSAVVAMRDGKTHGKTRPAPKLSFGSSSGGCNSSLSRAVWLVEQWWGPHALGRRTTGRGPVLAAWCFGALGSYLVACCPVQQLGWHQAPEWGHSFLYYAGRECHYYSPSDTAAPPSRPTLPLDSGLRAGPFCRKRKDSEEKNHCGSRSSRTTLPGAQRDRAGRAGHGWQARLSHILQQLPAIQALEEPGEPASKTMLGSAAMLLLQSAAVVLVGQWSDRGWQSIMTSLLAEMPGEPARLLLRGHQGPATPSSGSGDPERLCHCAWPLQCPFANGFARHHGLDAQQRARLAVTVNTGAVPVPGVLAS
ncbi:uncharacterized protein LOC144144120 [Haemaphysalis longicornis]